MSRIIGAGEFKAKCLKLIDEINERGDTLIITKHGKPVAELRPTSPRGRKSPVGALKGTISYMGDVISPVEAVWEAQQE